MSDKLRAAALAALNMLNDYHDCLQAANILRVGLAEQTVQKSLTVAEQEPVACIGTNGKLMWLKKPSTIYSKPRPLYAAPPRREWVGLTDEDKTEIKKLVTYDQFETAGEYANRVQAATESKLKKKNT